MRGTTVLVEGESDRLALVAFAARFGHDLPAENAAVVLMGGVTNIARFPARYGPDGAGHHLLGLCDEAEAWYVRRALDRAGIGSGSLPGRGFQVCRADLEDELIRALGPGRRGYAPNSQKSCVAITLSWRNSGNPGLH